MSDHVYYLRDSGVHSASINNMPIEILNKIIGSLTKIADIVQFVLIFTRSTTSTLIVDFINTNTKLKTQKICYLLRYMITKSINCNAAIKHVYVDMVAYLYLQSQSQSHMYTNLPDDYLQYLSAYKSGGSTLSVNRDLLVDQTITNLHNQKRQIFIARQYPSSECYARNCPLHNDMPNYSYTNCRQTARTDSFKNIWRRYGIRCKQDAKNQIVVNGIAPFVYNQKLFTMIGDKRSFILSHGLAPLQMACVMLNKYFSVNRSSGNRSSVNRSSVNRSSGNRSSGITDLLQLNKSSQLSAMICRINQMIYHIGPSLDVESREISYLSETLRVYRNIEIISICLRILQTYPWTGLFEKLFAVISRSTSDSIISSIQHRCMQSYNHIIKLNTVKFIFRQCLSLRLTKYEIIEQILKCNTIVTKKVVKYMFDTYLKNDKEYSRKIIHLYASSINSYSQLKYYCNYLIANNPTNNNPTNNNFINFATTFISENMSCDVRLHTYIFRKVPYESFKIIIRNEKFIVNTMLRMDPSSVYELFKTHEDYQSFMEYCSQILILYSLTFEIERFLSYKP